MNDHSNYTEMEPIVIEDDVIDDFIDDDVIVIDNDTDEKSFKSDNDNRMIEVIDDDDVYDVLNEISGNEIRGINTQNDQLISEIEVQRQRNFELQQENNAQREQYTILNNEREAMRAAHFNLFGYQNLGGGIHIREISTSYFTEVNDAVLDYEILTETDLDRFSSVYYAAMRASNAIALRQSRIYYKRREMFDNSDESNFYREQVHYFEDRERVLSELVWLKENIEKRNIFIEEQSHDLGIYREVYNLTTEQVSRLDRRTFEELKRNRRELDHFLNSYIATRRYLVQMETAFDNKYIAENPGIRHDEFNYYRGINIFEDQNDPVVDINVIGHDEANEEYLVQHGYGN